MDDDHVRQTAYWSVLGDDESFSPESVGQKAD
jgi:hypothetical protein